MFLPIHQFVSQHIFYQEWFFSSLHKKLCFFHCLFHLKNLIFVLFCLPIDVCTPEVIIFPHSWNSKPFSVYFCFTARLKPSLVASSTPEIKIQCMDVLETYHYSNPATLHLRVWKTVVDCESFLNSSSWSKEKIRFASFSVCGCMEVFPSRDRKPQVGGAHSGEPCIPTFLPPF